MNREDIRYRLLAALEKEPGYTANQEVLLDKLLRKGHALNRDHIKIELSWLAGHADAVHDQIVESVHIATLTLEGLEIVKGTRVVPGIRRPLPGEGQ